MHIVKTGLTILTQANIPLSFWWEVFHTTSFLINKILTTLSATRLSVSQSVWMYMLSTSQII